MAKRRTKRKVTVVLRSVNPEDRLGLLQDVEEAFKPGEITVVQESADAAGRDLSDPIADEELETRVKEKASELLDARAREIKEKAQQEAEQQSVEVPPVDTGTSKSMTDLAKERAKADRWLSEKLKAGWRFVVKLIEMAKNVKDIVS